MAYKVSDDGITINVSDEISTFPDKKTPKPDADGVIMYYELLNPKDNRSILWREKLAEGLKKSFKDVAIPKAILTDFPKGYKLYAHRKKYPNKEERTDFYLFGRHKFRSPNEFLPHLIWLVSDKSEQCHCKYCSKSITTSVKRKVPRRRDTDTSDEASVSKRITRNDAKKDMDNRKKVTNDRKKADSRETNTKKSSTKKRKSESVELEKNIPPPVPKYSVFREGEIVWLDANKVLNDETLAECNKNFSIDSQLDYWPAIVGTVTAQDDNESYESIIYTVKPLILHGNKNVAIDSLRPWLIHGSKKTFINSNRFTRSLLNINLDKANPKQIVEIYFKAIQKASEIAKVITPVYRYDYHKSKRIKEKRDGVYFKAIYFGAELIYEDDLVRLLPENQSDPIDDDNQHKEAETSYLQVTSIFEDSKKGFEVTGDLYERCKLLEKDEHEWIPKNKDEEEYTVSLSDIAGRLYPDSVYPDITESFTCELLKTSEGRTLMLGEDVPPIITNIETPREPNGHKTPPTLIVRKRSSPSPTASTEHDVLKGKRPSPLLISQNTPSKRVRGHLEIEIKRDEIKFSDEGEITINQTSEIQETQTIEKVGSPVKFSDIEKRYARKSDDIELPPLVVSPDTPTFETDDDISDGERNNATDNSDDTNKGIGCIL